MDENSGVRIDIKTLIAAGSLAVSVFVLVNQYSSDNAAHEALQDKRLCILESRARVGECAK